MPTAVRSSLIPSAEPHCSAFDGQVHEAVLRGPGRRCHPALVLPIARDDAVVGHLGSDERRRPADDVELRHVDGGDGDARRTDDRAVLVGHPHPTDHRLARQLAGADGQRAVDRHGLARGQVVRRVGLRRDGPLPLGEHLLVIVELDALAGDADARDHDVVRARLRIVDDDARGRVSGRRALTERTPVEVHVEVQLGGLPGRERHIEPGRLARDVQLVGGELALRDRGEQVDDGADLAGRDVRVDGTEGVRARHADVGRLVHRHRVEGGRSRLHAHALQRDRSACRCWRRCPTCDAPR